MQFTLNFAEFGLGYLPAVAAIVLISKYRRFNIFSKIPIFEKIEKSKISVKKKIEKTKFEFVKIYFSLTFQDLFVEIAVATKTRPSKRFANFVNQRNLYQGKGLLTNNVVYDSRKYSPNKSPLQSTSRRSIIPTVLFGRQPSSITIEKKSKSQIKKKRKKKIGKKRDTNLNRIDSMDFDLVPIKSPRNKVVKNKEEEEEEEQERQKLKLKPKKKLSKKKKRLISKTPEISRINISIKPPVPSNMFKSPKNIIKNLPNLVRKKTQNLDFMGFHKVESDNNDNDNDCDNGKGLYKARESSLVSSLDYNLKSRKRNPISSNNSVISKSPLPSPRIPNFESLRDKRKFFTKIGSLNSSRITSRSRDEVSWDSNFKFFPKKIPRLRTALKLRSKRKLESCLFSSRNKSNVKRPRDSLPIFGTQSVVRKKVPKSKERKYPAFSNIFMDTSAYDYGVQGIKTERSHNVHNVRISKNFVEEGKNYKTKLANADVSFSSFNSFNY